MNAICGFIRRKESGSRARAYLPAILLLLVVFEFTGLAQTNNASGNASREEQVRADCIKGRRYICGRVVQITPEGLVVDSGYSSLLDPPFRTSWVVPGNVSVTRDRNAIESQEPDSVCIGLVFVMDIPKRPTAKLDDYVVIHGYPAGQYEYVPVPKVQKTIRRFSAGLERAVKQSLEAKAK